MIGVMEPLSGEENGHPGGLKNGPISWASNGRFAPLWSHFGTAPRGSLELQAVGVVSQAIDGGRG
jgi:hypothetical protein